MNVAFEQMVEEGGLGPIAVLYGEPPSLLGIPCCYRLDDILMFAPGIQPADTGHRREVPSYLLPQVLQNLPEELVVGGGGDRRVELRVQSADRFEVLSLRGLGTTANDPSESIQLLICCPFGGHLAGTLFKALTELENLPHLLHGGVSDVCAGVGAELEPARSLEEAERLSDRSTGNAEFARNRVLHQMGPRRIQPINDPGLQILEDALGQRTVLILPHGGKYCIQTEHQLHLWPEPDD